MINRFLSRLLTGAVVAFPFAYVANKKGVSIWWAGVFLFIMSIVLFLVTINLTNRYIEKAYPGSNMDELIQVSRYADILPPWLSMFKSITIAMFNGVLWMLFYAVYRTVKY